MSKQVLCISFFSFSLDVVSFIFNLSLNQAVLVVWLVVLVHSNRVLCLNSVLGQFAYLHCICFGSLQVIWLPPSG